MEGEVERLNKELGGVREKLDRTQVATKPSKVSVEEGLCLFNLSCTTPAR